MTELKLNLDTYAYLFQHFLFKSKHNIGLGSVPWRIFFPVLDF